MVKQHQKRKSIPRTWALKRKESTWVTRPSPGAHSRIHGMSINTALKEMLRLTKTTKETRQVLQHVLVNGRKVSDHRFIVGLFDVISFPKTKENFRIVLNQKGKLEFRKISEAEAKLRPAKILNKTRLKGGKLQLNLSDGTNILLKKNDYAAEDTLILENPSNTISAHLKLEKGALIYLIAGKHIGSSGAIKEIKGHMLAVTDAASKAAFETLKKYAIVIGKDKPMITL